MMCRLLSFCPGKHQKTRLLFSVPGRIWPACIRLSSGHYAARRAGVDSLNALMRAVRACACPVIAAVEGGAGGAGVALALGCDLIVASEQARFTATQMTAGLTPDAGLTLFYLLVCRAGWCRCC